MAKILLIHGYGVGMKLAFDEMTRIHLGFKAFEYLIREKEAVLFEWYLSKPVNDLEFLNPLTQYQVYRAELEMAHSPEIRQRLAKFIDQEEPETIVCHSMGSLLLMLTLKDYQLPDFVRNIVFVEADLPQKIDIPEALLKRLENQQLRWFNYFCNWDISLITSMFLNLYLPAGLAGTSTKYIKNIFFPLKPSSNIHMSSIQDPEFARDVSNLST